MFAGDSHINQPNNETHRTGAKSLSGLSFTEGISAFLDLALAMFASHLDHARIAVSNVTAVIEMATMRQDWSVNASLHWQRGISSLVQSKTFFKCGLLHGLAAFHTFIPSLQVLKTVKANWSVLVRL